MSRSFLPADESLPTWLHTLLCFLVVSPFAVPLLWAGMQAIDTRHLEPLSGPEFGQFFFGARALDGNAAVLAGMALILLSATFAALALSFTRYAAERFFLRALPWILLALGSILSFSVRSF